MRYIFIALLMHMVFTVPSSNSYASVAEASMGPHQDFLSTYDLSALSPEEKKWFVTFVEGTFFADGWQEIANSILARFPGEERQLKQRELRELGFKIGREWCKQNSIRKIDTGQLKEWGHLLKSTANDNPDQLSEIIDHIDGEVESLLD